MNRSAARRFVTSRGQKECHSALKSESWPSDLAGGSRRRCFAKINYDCHVNEIFRRTGLSAKDDVVMTTGRNKKRELRGFEDKDERTVSRCRDRRRTSEPGRSWHRGELGRVAEG